MNSNPDRPAPDEIDTKSNGIVGRDINARGLSRRHIIRVLDRDVVGDQRFGAAGFTEDEIALARELERLSREWGLEPYQVSLAWLLSRPAVASAIVGAETPEELTANASAADVELDPAQLEVLTALASEPAAFHHRAGDGPKHPSASRSPASGASTTTAR